MPPIIRWSQTERQWEVVDDDGQVIHRAPTLLSAEGWITGEDQQ